MGKKSIGLLVVSLSVVSGLAWLKLNYPRSLETPKAQVPEQPKAPNLPPDIAGLNAIQEEIGKLSQEEITKQMADLKAELKSSGLLDKVNKDLVKGEEKEKAKNMLVRLSLLAVEQRKRVQEDRQAEKD